MLLKRQYDMGLRTSKFTVGCDKILRVQGKEISADKIIQLLDKENYQCKVLE